MTDVRAAFQEEGSRLRPWDFHPSPLGHERIADGLAKDLSRLGWLGRCR